MWSKECDKAFEELKAYLAIPLILSQPEKEEVLYAFVAVAEHAMSLVLTWADEGIQKPKYYINKIPLGGRGQVSPSGESNSCYHPCHEEVAPLLPSPHCDCFDSVALTSIASEVRLYRKGGK